MQPISVLSLKARCQMHELEIKQTSGYATWFTAGARGAIRIAHYDVIDDVIIWGQDGNCQKWLERILVSVRSTI